MRVFEHLTLGERSPTPAPPRAARRASPGSAPRAPGKAAAVASPQRLRGGDVGEDHELLDQPVRVEPLPEREGFDRAVVGQHDPAFWQVEIERLARFARRVRRP